MKLDSNNRRLIIQRYGKLDVIAIKKEYGGIENIFRCVCLVMNWLVQDENLQVNGVQFFVDYTGMTMHHAKTLYTPENAKRIMKWYQNSLPGRLKGLNLYNEPPFYDLLFTIVSPFLKDKTRDRMILHGKNMANVYEVVDKELLPTEYLPDDYKGPSAGSMEQIVEDMITDMQRPEFVTYMKEMTGSTYGVDLNLKPKDEDPIATYRKLNVD